MWMPRPGGYVAAGGRGGILGSAGGEDAPILSASSGPFIGASNLSSTKARLLLMATLMKLGSLPPAMDPDHPTAAERAATDENLAEYRRIFRCH